MISYKNYESVDEYHDQRFDLIRRLESTVVNPYYDQEGIPTIGVVSTYLIPELESEYSKALDW